MPSLSVGVPIDSMFGIPNNKGMLTSDAISHFGSKAALAKAIGISVPSVYEWREYPPPLRQLQIEQVSGGALKAEPDVFDAKPARAAV